MANSGDPPAAIRAGGWRDGGLALPTAAALELDALRSGAPSRVPLSRGAWTAAGLYMSAFVRGGRREDELSLKIRRSKVSREHDRTLTDRLVEAVARAFPGLARELVVSVPQPAGDEDRFRYIRAGLAGRIGAADGGPALRQTRVVACYRELRTPQRRASCPGRFAAHDHVRGRSVRLIDDVVTSGAQASEVIRALAAAGARLVRFAAVAIAAAAPEDARAPRRTTRSPSRTAASLRRRATNVS